MRTHFGFSIDLALRYAADAGRRKTRWTTGKAGMGKAGRIAFWVVVIGAATVCIGVSYRIRFRAEKKISTEAAAAARAEAQRIQQEVVLFTKRAVPAGRPFAEFVEGFGITPLMAARLVASAQPVFDLRHVRAGNQLAVGRSVLGELRAVRYSIDADRVLS